MPQGIRDAPELRCIDIGLIGYLEAITLQGRLARARQNGLAADHLLLLEHPPTYTRGRRADPEELPFGDRWYSARGIEIHETDRGGRVTYHGPGQLVAYPIVDLGPLGNDLHRYIRLLEQTVIEVLRSFDLRAQTIDGLTGVWVRDRKIASLGIHVSRGVTTHGFAVNVNNDLEPFEWIVPCGLKECRVTSIAKETGRSVNMGALKNRIAGKFAELFCSELRAGSPFVEKQPFSLDEALESGAALELLDAHRYQLENQPA